MVDTSFTATDRRYVYSQSLSAATTPSMRIANSSGSLSTDTAIQVEFGRHEKRWKKETAYSSSLSDKYLHPSYARIIGLGPSVVPLILKSLRKEPSDWFYALRALTGANPVSSSDAGDMHRMATAWLRWGEERRLA